MIADCHMHTCFSDDSDTPVEDMAEQAIRLGMERIYITDHHDIGFPRGEFRLDTASYVKKIQEVKKKYEGRLEIHLGVEMGIQAHLGEELKAYANQYPFEYIIGSVHLVVGQDPDLRDELDLTDEEMYREYFLSTLETVKAIGDFQSLGHLDYIVRYGYTNEKEYSYYKYAEIIDEILKELIRKEIALEVNTGGLKSGLSFPNPHPDILKRYKELGGTMVTVGSDAHIPGHIGHQFQLLPQILSDAGFRYITQFRERKPEFIKI